MLTHGVHHLARIAFQSLEANVVNQTSKDSDMNLQNTVGLGKQVQVVNRIYLRPPQGLDLY